MLNSLLPDQTSCAPTLGRNGHPTNCPVSEDHFEGTSSVTATVGRDITLPCKHFTGSQDITLLEWIKDGEDVVFSLREGVPVLQDNYKDKVSSPPSKEKHWALGLRRVEECDQAEYCCCFMVGDGDRKCSSV
ncbi:hypothetical protein INR49_023176 [Caranx melampygus]|nr:hypothetical protein INR49_023176 [Caranx melampygus]